MKPAANSGCILLAAGASTRLGYPKQLLRQHGETLLHRTARIALEAGLDPVCVVLAGASSELQAELQDLAVEIVINPDWQQGMASSLRAGLHRLTVNGPWIDRVVLLVCDQVALDNSHIRALWQASNENPAKIVASFYGGKAGVPAVFPATYFEDLSRMQGDHGARELLRQQGEQVITLPFPQGEQDIDTAEDVVRAGLQRKH